jgi:hypothetical protein
MCTNFDICILYIVYEKEIFHLVVTLGLDYLGCYGNRTPQEEHENNKILVCLHCTKLLSGYSF